MALEDTAVALDDGSVKACCAGLYESDIAALLMGDSLHPGGLPLTERLGEVLQLTPESRVLDVAAGNGASAVFLAERFGCKVRGIDYGGLNVERAIAHAAERRVDQRVRFERADAERIPVPDGTYDAIICECAFCLFPDKDSAAREFARVLRSGGRVGLSDVTRKAVLPDELSGLLAWMACIADAQPVEGYTTRLESAGLTVERVEEHDRALIELVEQVRGRLLAAEVLLQLKKLNLPDFDLAAARQMATRSLAAIKQRQLGYIVITAAKPGLRVR